MKPPKKPGLSWNLRYTRISGLKRLGIHIQQLLLCPVIGVIETLPAFYAVVEFFVLRRPARDFHVIAK